MEMQSVPISDDISHLYEVLLDQKYNAMRICLKPDPSEAATSIAFGMSPISETKEGEAAQLGRDSG
jgi:hypothetical protein